MEKIGEVPMLLTRNIPTEYNATGEELVLQPVDAVLGQYSELFFLLAALTYAVAFVFFCWDFATAYQFNNAAGSEESKSLDEEQAKRKEKKLVLANGDDKRSAFGAKNVTAVDHQLAGEGLKMAPSRSLSGSSQARIAMAITIVGFVLNAVAVFLRAVAANRVPWGNMYEFCTTGVLLVVGVFLVLTWRKSIRFIGAFVLGIALVMLLSATLTFHMPVSHLVPALNSYWLIIHVSIAVLAAAMFTISCIISVLQLIQTWRARKTAVVGHDLLKRMRVVPSAQVLEDMAYRINVFGFILWSITIIFGAIWAENAWGRFWGWDPKEVWSFIIWLVYAAYLHARSTRGWMGNRSAWLSITGYVCVIFNFTVVNIFAAGLHSYAGG